MRKKQILLQDEPRADIVCSVSPPRRHNRISLTLASTILRHEIVVKPLPAGCRLTAIFDSCHSGTVMDLPYVVRAVSLTMGYDLMSDSQYSTEGTIKEPNLLEGAQDDLLAAGKSAMMGNTDGLFKGLFGAAKGAFDANAAYTKTKKNNTSPADVIQWAGCKDSQTVSGHGSRRAGSPIHPSWRQYADGDPERGYRGSGQSHRCNVLRQSKFHERWCALGR